MRWIRSKAFIATCVAVVVVVIGATAGLLLAGHAKPARHPKRHVVAAPSATPPVKKGPLLSPFTGEPIKSLGPVLAVKIDNIVYARPQTGLTSADIVYVLPVEGGLTRFLAIFSSHFPPIIGPVRSARFDDLQLLQQFGRPAFAWSGAEPGLVPVVERARIVDLYANLVNGYFRSSDRIAPYNLYAYTSELLSQAKGASIAHNIGFTFGNAPPGGRFMYKATVSYPSATYTFRWSRARQHWLVWMDGAPAMTTSGQQLSPATVVIQYTVVRTSAFHEYGLRPPFAESAGQGTAVVLRNGREYQVHWSRPNVNGGTTFTTLSGKPMNFAPGQVWVLLVASTAHGRWAETQ